MMARSGTITSVSSQWRVGASSRGGPPVFVLRQPNKRLKLAGGDRSRGIGVLCAGAHELSFICTARGGRVARSLSAIR